MRKQVLYLALVLMVLSTGTAVVVTRRGGSDRLRPRPYSEGALSGVVVAITQTTLPPPTTIARASRGGLRVRPRIEAPSVAEDCNAWGWHRTRAQSDACWGEMVASYGDWPVTRMLTIMYCESRGDPFAKNPRSSATGLFQILGASQGDGPGNIALAHSMWQSRGTSPWRACGG